MVGFVLRLDGLARQALWSDEDITLDRARLPLGEMLGGLPVEHAPVYFASMRPWTILAGDGDYALRFPSALAGAVAVALAGYVGSRLFGRVAGIIAALLVATQPFAVSYGQEARMYSLLLALCFAAPAAVLRAEAGAQRGVSSRRWWLAAGVLTALAALTHYYGALIAIVLGAWGLHDVFWAGRSAERSTGANSAFRSDGDNIDVTRSTIVRRWSLTGIVAALLFLPWLPRALGVGGFPGWRETTAPAALRSIVGAWLGGTSVGSDPLSGGEAIGFLAPDVALPLAVLVSIPLVLAAVGAVWAAGVFFILLRRGQTGEVTWTNVSRILAWLALPTAAVAILLWRKPDIHPRYLMPLHAAVWLSAGAGVEAIIRRVPRRARTLTAMVLLAAVALAAAAPLRAYRSGDERQKQDYRSLLAEVDRHADGRDSILLLDGPSMGLAKRYAPSDTPVKLENLRSETNRARSAGDFEARLAELAERRPNVWLATNGASEHLADDWLVSHLYAVSTQGFQDITLRRYFADRTDLLFMNRHEWENRRCVDARSAFVDQDAHDPIPPSASVCLDFAVRVVNQVQPSDIVPIWLKWQTGEAWPSSPPASREHRVSVRLVDQDGTIVASADRRPAAWTRPTTGWAPGESVRDQHGLLVPLNAPAGNHRIEIILYDEETLEKFAAWAPVPTVEVVLDTTGEGDQ